MLVLLNLQDNSSLLGTARLFPLFWFKSVTYLISERERDRKKETETEREKKESDGETERERGKDRVKEREEEAIPVLGVEEAAFPRQ